MRYLSTGLLADLFEDVTTLAYCWRLERTDGVVTGFTSFSENLTIDGVTYQAATGFIPSATELNNKLEVNNLSVTSFLSDDSITEADLIAGIYDLAKLKIFLVNYLDLPTALTGNPLKLVLLSEGTLGKVNSSDRGFSVELRAFTQYLNQKTSFLTSPFCRYQLGDSLCGVNLSSHTQNVTITGTSNNTILYTTESMTVGRFAYGVAEFTSGDNDGLKLKVSKSDGYSLTLFEAAPYPVAAGDTLALTAGCDKSRDACKSFSNILNFGGEPDVPGVDEYLAGYQE
jgi:uncharacterized phage protein (TIGR02218 family)